jgi:hypothetical protein
MDTNEHHAHASHDFVRADDPEIFDHFKNLLFQAGVEWVIAANGELPVLGHHEIARSCPNGCCVEITVDDDANCGTHNIGPLPAGAPPQAYRNAIYARLWAPFN